MPPPTAAAEEGGSPRREEQVAPPAPPPSASSGNPLANVTSSLRRAGTQVKRLGRKILAETTSVLPGGFQHKDRDKNGDGLFRPNDGRDDDDLDGADGSSPGSHSTPRPSRPRYLDLGPLDPRHVLTNSSADSADPPEGYVNVWQGNFRRWQKRWLAATTPGVLTMHRRASKMGPSVSVDLTSAAVLVAESADSMSGGGSGASIAVSKTNKSGSSRQFLVVTPEKTYRIRVLRARCRAPWVACIERSAESLERARALVRSRGRVLNGSSRSRESGRASFDRKPSHVRRATSGRPKRPGQALEISTARLSSATATPHTHRSAPSDGGANATAETHRLDPEAVRLALRERFLSADANPALHAARDRATRSASAASASATGRSASAAASFVGAVGSFMSGGAEEAATDETEAASDAPHDVVAAVAAMRAAYDSTLSAVLERCAEAEERAARHRTRSAHLASALAEFAGVVPSPGAASGEAHVGFGRGDGTERHVDADGHPFALPDVEIVTPGQSGFAAALRGRGEPGGSGADGADGAAAPTPSAGSDASGSDEYGSVLSFATGVSGGSSFRTGSGSVADDLDLLVAAEVVNRHDFVLSRSRGAGDDDARAEKTANEKTDDFDEEDDDDDDASVVSTGTANASNSDSDDESTEAYARAPRERLPAPQPLNQSFSLWDLLRKNIGKDLSRVSMPANINQPLSLLQRTVEDFEYLHLLYEAIDCDASFAADETETNAAGPAGASAAEPPTDASRRREKPSGSTERVALLATFAASSYASWYGRAQKPFASTLGETYDWVSPDGRVRVVCECVVYDPPVAAFHARGVTPKGTPFVVHGEGAGASAFYGRYVQVNVKGGLHLELPRTRERYSWSKAAMHVHNVISGRVWVDMVGEVTVVAHPVLETDAATRRASPSPARGGERASFRLRKGSKPTAGRPDTRGRVEGSVFDRHGEKTASLVGNCLEAVWIERDEAYAGDAPVRDRRVRGDAGARGPTLNPKPAEADAARGAPAWRFGGVARDAARQYGFTPFAIALNELTPEGARNLPPTDSRFRPDMRALENGDSEEASRAKTRVEERNRALAAARRRRGETYAPVWFAKRDGAERLDAFPDDSAPEERAPSGPSSPDSSRTSGVACSAKRASAPPPFGKHVNSLEHRTSLWAYKGGYWEQRETGEFEDPALVTDERFDVFDLAAEWRAERTRRREKLQESQSAFSAERETPPSREVG